MYSIHFEKITPRQEKVQYMLNTNTTPVQRLFETFTLKHMLNMGGTILWVGVTLTY